MHQISRLYVQVHLDFSTKCEGLSGLKLFDLWLRLLCAKKKLDPWKPDIDVICSGITFVMRLVTSILYPLFSLTAINLHSFLPGWPRSQELPGRAQPVPHLRRGWPAESATGPATQSQQRRLHRQPGQSALGGQPGHQPGPLVLRAHQQIPVRQLAHGEGHRRGLHGQRLRD